MSRPRNASTLVLGLLGLLLCATPGCVTQQQYDEALGSLKSAEDAMGAKEQELAACRNELSTLQTDFEGKLAATEQELAELRKQREAAEARLSEFKDLQEKFRKMIEAGDLEVYIRRGRMVVGLPSAVLFASGKSELSKKGKKAVGQVAKVLSTLDRRVLVSGHTDNVPIGKNIDVFKDNWDLSTVRALNVTRFLIEKGMPSENLGAAGYGEFDPAHDNKKKAGRRKNRRIELVLEPDLSELPRIGNE